MSQQDNGESLRNLWLGVTGRRPNMLDPRLDLAADRAGTSLSHVPSPSSNGPISPAKRKILLTAAIGGLYHASLEGNV